MQNRCYFMWFVLKLGVYIFIIMSFDELQS